MWLGALAGQSQAQLDGFKSRALRVAAPEQRHLYVTEWRTLEMVERAGGSPILVVDEEELCMAGSIRPASSVTYAELATQLGGDRWETVVARIATQRPRSGRIPLSALEVVLALVQAQAGAATVPMVWLLSSGVQAAGSGAAHAGAWGLARSARAEVALPLKCVDAPVAAAYARLPLLNEPEALLHGPESCSPRLRRAHSPPEGLMRLHFHARGLISNLFLEPQPAAPPLGDAELLLRVRAVGLNFRDVLNVLGEYPGDPGPPGGDAAGVVAEGSAVHPAGGAAFGLGHAPLASFARSTALLLTHKPVTLTFEKACTLPVVWSTAHVALACGGLHAGHSIVIQAAAGGVGLKAVEYAQWLLVPIMGTAGQPHKHGQLRTAGVRVLSSSRNGAAFALGAARFAASNRLHAVLNSLSLDFIVASFMTLGEGGAFEEIGKRGIWASERRAASAPLTVYCAVALDADMGHTPAWMHSALLLVSVRANAAVVTSLPLHSFDMHEQHELAFRNLQGGLNTGKVVVRVARGSYEVVTGSHVVTGGMGGLGLLTCRWLAQCGARHLALASRSGAIARDAAAELVCVQASGTVAHSTVCDMSGLAHVQRLMSVARSIDSVWHAAGVLVDALLPRQSANALALVSGPKAHGAWSLHAACAAARSQAFTLFSSVAALLGGAGQANYAAANACLDALATCRRVAGRASVSVQWGAWAEVGMAARGVASERMAAMQASSGFSRIGLAHGLAVMGMSMRRSTSSVLGVVPVAWSRALGGGAAVPAFLSAFTPRSKGAQVVGRVSVAGGCIISLEAVLEMVKRTAGGAPDADAPLMDAGVDSLGAVELRNTLLNAAGGRSLPSTIVFDHPTARQLTSVLQPARAASAVAVSAPHGPLLMGVGGISIGGLSALLPAGASSSMAASRMVACGCDAVTEIPASRWDMHAQLAKSELVMSRIRHTGFVCGAELADNAAFGVSPSEAVAMDPCQRLLLERGYSALHDAYLDRTALSSSLTGIFLGFAGSDFAQVLAAPPTGGSVYAATGSAVSIASGRFSYALGLHGPCVTYDTACSAALTACHAGLRALQLGECAIALVAGVSLVLAPGVGTSFAAAGMTSARGRSHTFDVRADGYTRGEACGGVVLCGGGGEGEALHLLGSAVRQDGRSASLTAPNGQAQQGLLIAALANAHMPLAALSLSEAHGTGTALGDPIEVSSLVAAVLPSREAPLLVGGVKANIGHAEPAAGITGLVKLAIGLQQGEAVPNAQLRALNPHVEGALSGAPCALAASVQRARCPLGHRVGVLAPLGTAARSRTLCSGAAQVRHGCCRQQFL